MNATTVSRLSCPKGCGKTAPAPPIPAEVTHPCSKFGWRHVAFVDASGQPMTLAALKKQKAPHAGAPVTEPVEMW